ncbi:MAG: DUF929 family protein [Planctomycetaceae bacterium]
MTKKKRPPARRPRQSGATRPDGPTTKARSAPTPKRAAPTRSSTRTALAAIGGVGIAAAIIIGVGIARNPKAPPPTTRNEAAQTVQLVTGVPAAALDRATVGPAVSPPLRLADGVPALTQDGKPEVFYLGAEYCPFCAAQRWPLIVALSRFGTFDGLGTSFSSPTDVFPNTPTFTFHGATYSSPYVAFTGVETADTAGAPLETPTAAQETLFGTYDAPPYTNSAGAIPFLMIGNRYVQIGASYQPTVLEKMSRLQIAQGLADPKASPASNDILASADVMTAAICELTESQPSDVCQSPGVTRAARSLPTQAP